MAVSHVGQNYSLLRRRLCTISNIHEWESSTIIEGGRLILPGQLITLDQPNLPPNVALEGGEMRMNEWQTTMFSAHDMIPIQVSLPGARQNDCQSHYTGFGVLFHRMRALGVAPFMRGKATVLSASFTDIERQIVWIAKMAEWIKNCRGFCLSLQQKYKDITPKD